MPSTRDGNPYQPRIPDDRQAAGSGWPSFVATVFADPVELCVVPFRADAQTRQIMLVDAQGQPGDGWLQACVRIAAGTAGPATWRELPQHRGWDVASDLAQLGLDRNTCDGGLLIFVVERHKGGILEGAVAFAAATWRRLQTVFGAPPAPARPTEDQIRQVVTGVTQADLGRSTAGW